MIISHKYRFIFLKTNKTAGTSIEIALSKFCGEKDIITPISLEDEQIRKSLGFRNPQNYFIPVRQYTLFDWIRLFYGRRKTFYNHISARNVKKLIDDDVWNSYFKFCFERNPWDRVISLYYWKCRKDTRISISEFIDSQMPRRLIKKGRELYSIDGKQAVDKIYLYENLKEAMEDIADRLDIPETIHLPQAKSHYRKGKRHYRDLLTRADADKITMMFCKEIAQFGYNY